MGHLGDTIIAIPGRPIFPTTLLTLHLRPNSIGSPRREDAMNKEFPLDIAITDCSATGSISRVPDSNLEMHENVCAKVSVSLCEQSELGTGPAHFALWIGVLATFTAMRAFVRSLYTSAIVHNARKEDIASRLLVVGREINLLKTSGLIYFFAQCIVDVLNVERCMGCNVFLLNRIQCCGVGVSDNEL
jgi:hypothetical protein